MLCPLNNQDDQMDLLIASTRYVCFVFDFVIEQDQRDFLLKARISRIRPGKAALSVEQEENQAIYDQVLTSNVIPSTNVNGQSCFEKAHVNAFDRCSCFERIFGVIFDRVEVFEMHYWR
jgi:hypothetical protein